MRHGPGPNIYTLLHYNGLGYNIRISKRLHLAKRALRVGQTIWISPAMGKLLREAPQQMRPGERLEYAQARERVMGSIDVVVVEDFEGAICEAF